MYHIFQLVLPIVFIITLIINTSNLLSAPAVTSFATGGHTVYHLRPATVDRSGERAVVTASYDGTVMSHRPDGRLLWQSHTNGSFPFALAAADITGDGLDEAFVACSDGRLYAFGPDGALLWTFERAAPLWAVSVTSDDQGNPLILTGGVDRTLYALDRDGYIRARHETDGVIRLIGCGQIRRRGVNDVAVSTTRHGLQGTQTLRLYRLSDLTPQWDREMGYRNGPPRDRYFSLEVCDQDGDGLDDIVFGGENDDAGFLTVYNGEGEQRIVEGCETYDAFNWQAIHPRYEWQKGRGVPQRPYEMNLLCHVKSPTLQSNRMFDIYGSVLIERDITGACRNILQGPYAFGGIAFDPQTNNLYLGSGISGGDDVYVLHLDREGWEQEFENIQPSGAMSQLERNMDMLLRQAKVFRAPAYQPEPEPVTVTLQQYPDEMQERYGTIPNIRFVTTYKYIEKFDPGYTNPKFIQSFNQRHSSRLTTREQIVTDARRWESHNEAFLLMGGHGRDMGIDFYISPETMVEVLEAAPNTFVGVVFAELEETDEALTAAVQSQLLPLAEKFYKHGRKKILLRNKNIFWNGNVHLDLFKETIMSDPRYREVFVPSMEETNSRTQGLSLAGRTGLWLTERFDHISGRAVTDNANWNRSWEWGQTMHLSHFIRALSLSRVYGADLFHINIYTDNKVEMLPLFHLLGSGALPRPERDELLSLSNVAIGMTRPDEEFIRHGTNGHGLDRYAPDTAPFVLDRLDGFWGAAPVPWYDLTNIAYNSQRRQMNFIPRLPYGMVTMIAAETNPSDFAYYRQVLRTDGRYWYDDQDQPHAADAWEPMVRETLEAAAERLPVRVLGDVSWSAVRIDPTHVRVILIDPGYLDPADREATIVMQHLQTVQCTDILSGETLPVIDNRTAVRVPMGILRIIDVEHR